MIDASSSCIPRPAADRVLERLKDSGLRLGLAEGGTVVQARNRRGRAAAKARKACENVFRLLA